MDEYQVAGMDLTDDQKSNIANAGISPTQFINVITCFAEINKYLTEAIKVLAKAFSEFAKKFLNSEDDITTMKYDIKKSPSWKKDRFYK